MSILPVTNLTAISNSLEESNKGVVKGTLFFYRAIY